MNLTAYFPSHAAAQNAIDELAMTGLGSDDLTLHDQATGGGTFMDGLKRFFGADAPHEAYGNGTLLTIRGDRQTAIPIITRNGGRLEGGEHGLPETAEQTMKLREERLSVDKESTRAGEVRLGKEVVTEQQRVDVPVAHEEVFISRRPVSERESIEDIGTIGEDREIVVPVMREEIAVEKRSFVTEEIGLNKQTVNETKTVGGTVRKERATIETDGEIDDQVIERSR